MAIRETKTGSDEAVRDVAWNVIRTPDAAGPLKSYRRLQSANDANQLCRVGAVDWLVLAGLPRELNWSPGPASAKPIRRSGVESVALSRRIPRVRCGLGRAAPSIFIASRGLNAAGKIGSAACRLAQCGLHGGIECA